MKAAIFSDQGGPEVLRYEDVETPSVGDGEVLLRVFAAALNRLDLKAREGRPEVAPYPHIGGLDVAGEIVDVGPGVERSRVGDRVVVYPVISCGSCDLCLAGDQALCDEQRVFGFQTQGGFAEYVAAPAANVVTVPASSDMRAFAALPCAYLTAWRMVVTVAKLQADEVILIHSVGSGVGSAALQISRYLGARAVVTAGTDEKLGAAIDMGAERALNYHREDVTQAALAATDGRGVDVVVDTVGADTLETSLRSAAKNARLVTCGVTSGAVTELNIRYLYQRQISVRGCVMGGKSELGSIVALAAQGVLRPIVADVMPLRDIRAAHEALESRTRFGKVVLSVAE
ncbi:zinc-binding dehydrogenase [Candidatus Poribacteria bacterium]|nr:zinc-binding dehydrogenase [Candidatus Poribacteria bacterium]MBT7099650.1 zinc-binding dehydrogenase [Candidatus Poribacteria bacterium]MBT7804666.1 zinc-binding dehydrogenase [Candidatus Poribacteria bacterium]